MAQTSKKTYSRIININSAKNITITSGMTKSPTVFPYNPRLSFTKFDKGDTEPYVCAQGYRRPLEQHKHVLKEEQG